MNNEQHNELIETIRNAGIGISLVLVLGIAFGSCAVWATGNVITDKLHFVGETINHKDCR